MYTEENTFTGETCDKPKIYWNEEEKYAIIAFLLTSIDKKADENGKVRLDDLFGLDGSQPEPDESEDGEISAKREARDAVVRECERFLDSLPDDERYDAVQDEIDNFIEGKDGRNLKCAIGGSYETFGTGYSALPQVYSAFGRCGKLEGGNCRLWDLVRLVVFDGDYSGNKRRLLKHLARKWDIDRTVLPRMEDVAKNLAAIERERRELSESDRPFREVTALLLELETREKEIWGNLEELGIVKACVGEKEDEEEDDYVEPGIGDKVADGICSGIETVTNILCAPFEWLTDKISGL